MERIALTCKDSGKFFHDCIACQHYNDCDYPDKKEIKMKRINFTIKQIGEASTVELIFRMNCLHAGCETRSEDAGIPMSDIWEANTIRKELRQRLGRLACLYGGLDEK